MNIDEDSKFFSAQNIKTLIDGLLSCIINVDLL